ncbi:MULTISPECIES: (2Fe-2S)-binding protein [unclassified Microbacterium]|uniref:(2Fe-2S)-binding protein n=1 Tax=unclassified Microbacterium TaxID=2609290 RepID=UPI0012F70DDD|nr:(2Fe-2S)-binding protein [Microbacterium sp. MAH-37]MVQ43358.1 (2Fe-2S)-binding protein [Microbacterium sp. MAH-37]
MTVTISFDGEQLDGREGQSIGGILLANGHRTWRDAQGGERGIFCGIGICQDCVITVNGVEGVRACQRTACEGDIVEREVRA